MGNCDVCNRMTTWESATTYSADEFRMIVAMGFQPSSEIVMMGPAAIQGWITGLVASSTTGWLLCPICAGRAAQFMPKTAGTGPAGLKLDETMTVNQLLGSAVLEGRLADAKPARHGCLTMYAFLLITMSLLLLPTAIIGGASVMSASTSTGIELVGEIAGMAILIGMGTLGLVLARGLWLMKNWARIGVILMQGGGVIIGLLSIVGLLMVPGGVETGVSGIICTGLAGLVIPCVIMGWFIKNDKYFQKPVQAAATPSARAPSPTVSGLPETTPALIKQAEVIPANLEPSATASESVPSRKQPDAPSTPVPETSKLVAEALEIIESRVVEFLPGGVIKSGGDTSEAMEAAKKLSEAHQLQPEDPWLHYAWASALHLAMQYQTGREEMERLAQTHPDFLLAKFAIEGWDHWDGLFTLPPWKPGIESLHPAMSAEIKAACVLGTRQELQPRATLFLRDAMGDFQTPSILQTVRIDITTVLSSDDPQIAVLYVRIWDNPDSPYQVEALGLPLYTRGSKLRCKYEYLCLQDDIDFAVIDNHDRILLNKRLPFPKRMRKTHKNLLNLLQSSPGREISDTELVSAVRSFQSRFSLSDVRY